MKDIVTKGCYVDSLDDCYRLNFFNNTHFSGNFYTASDTYNLKNMSVTDFVEDIISLYPTAQVIGYSNSWVIVEIRQPSPIFMAFYNDKGRLIEQKNKREIQVEISGELHVVKELFAKIDLKYSSNKKARIEWWYMSKGTIASTYIHIEEPPKVIQECYPWIKDQNNKKQNPYDYFKDYLKSTSQILFLSGEPGTGKTSFLRSMIYENELNASVGYDPEIFKTDRMFIDFLSGDSDILIMEDAEILIHSRFTETNEMMSRFLNVSDGLVKPKGKKIVFTTNSKNFSDIDPALTRAGRCHDFMEFRLLTFNEAQIAAKALDIAVPEKEKEYSLAELFNPQTKQMEKRRVGFL